MALSATVKTAAGIVTSLGVIGGGAIHLDSRHAPAALVSEVGVMQIFDLVEMAQRDGKSEWICRAIEQSIIELCSKQKDHYLCEDEDARHDLKKKAGCD